MSCNQWPVSPLREKPFHPPEPWPQPSGSVWILTLPPPAPGTLAAFVLISQGPRQGLSFMGPSFWKILLDMLRGQASLLELLTFSFRQRHVLTPPPRLETNMLFILHLSPLYICFSNLSTLDIYSLIICLPSHRLGASIRFPLVSHVTALFFSGAWL